MERYHEEKVELESKIGEKRVFEKLEVHDTEILDDGENKIFSILFTNTTNEKIKNTYARIYFLDKSGNELGNESAYVMATEPGETTQARLYINDIGNVKEIYDFKIEKSNF